jgi:hypothetical protein
MTEYETFVVRTVYEKQGIKATELACIAAKAAVENNWDRREPFPDLVERMIQEGRIKEVEYCVPQIPQRIKSFLLPSGARIRLDQGEAWQ